MTKKLNATAEPSATTEPSLAIEPEGGWPPDQYTGVGGSYVRDPVTGLRSPVITEQAPAEGAPASDESTTGEK